MKTKINFKYAGILETNPEVRMIYLTTQEVKKALW